MAIKWSLVIIVFDHALPCFAINGADGSEKRCDSCCRPKVCDVDGVAYNATDGIVGKEPVVERMFMLSFLPIDGALKEEFKLF
eukprot:CAMPEP_0181497880 /NCGR_PEP_ID=MMETSP1110-20121109/53780_1 /TAXON_ID=174948 /ORGANISM="Symbiodinium sp., Strain CCMP421" /LENGTH=82 /DNA_ID=CAMNT_0023625867 /DNA_START=452 /DNA_END=698 /DNA_ORIENTATION=+